MDHHTWPAHHRETDADLVARSRRGSRGAFAELIRRHEGWLMNMLLDLADSQADAEDLAQDALVTAWQRLGHLREDHAFAAWLRRIAVNKALAQRRQWARRGQFGGRGPESPEDAQSPNPAAATHDAAESLAVRQVLRQMKPEHAVVLVLREMQGLTYQEIAETLGTPVGTVRSRIHHARESFRRLWQK